MKSTGFFKVAACLAVLFVLGGVCGYALSFSRPVQRVQRARLEQRWLEAKEREDAERLKLTAEQQEKVRPIYQQLTADIRRVREQAAREIGEAMRRHGRALRQELTPEQQEEFNRLMEERRAHWRQPGPMENRPFTPRP